MTILDLPPAADESALGLPGPGAPALRTVPALSVELGPAVGYRVVRSTHPEVRAGDVVSSAGSRG